MFDTSNCIYINSKNCSDIFKKKTTKIHLLNYQKIILMERLTIIQKHLKSNQTAGKNTLSMTDNRTGKTIEVQIKNNFINCNELAKFTDTEGEPLRSYDPGYMNTIACVK